MSFMISWADASKRSRSTDGGDSVKRFLSLCLTVFLLVSFTSAVFAEVRAPLRIARIPIILQGWQVPDADTLAALETKLDRALHIPLNDTLHAMEYLPEAECMAALEQVMSDLRQRNRRVKLKDAMKPLAEVLRADIVVCPVLRDYWQYTGMSWNWNRGLILHSAASVELAGYERATDRVFDKEYDKSYHSDYSSWGTADALAGECMDHVIQEAGLHDMTAKWYRSLSRTEGKE